MKVTPKDADLFRKTFGQALAAGQSFNDATIAALHHVYTYHQDERPPALQKGAVVDTDGRIVLLFDTEAEAISYCQRFPKTGRNAVALHTRPLGYVRPGYAISFDQAAPQVNTKDFDPVFFNPVQDFDL